jgi:hypothetical protein
MKANYTWMMIFVVGIFVLSILDNTALSFLDDKDLLFSIGLEYQSDFENKTVSDVLVQEFEKNGHALSKSVNISEWVGWEQDGKPTRWLITDNGNEKMYIAIKNTQINILSFVNQFIPIDNAEQNPDFKKFRDRLIDAVKKKDVKFLLGHTDENIKFSFGDPGGGIKNFIEEWKLKKNPEKSKIWHELGEVLRFGGDFDDEKTSFVAPIFFAKWPSIFDPFEYCVIAGEKVNVRLEPSSKSNIVKTLNYDIIKATNLDDNSKAVKETINGETYQWVEIYTLYGVHGYVFEKYIRSSVDYRAFFKKESGVWKMTLLVNGD